MGADRGRPCSGSADGQDGVKGSGPNPSCWQRNPCRADAGCRAVPSRGAGGFSFGGAYGDGGVSDSRDVGDTQRADSGDKKGIFAKEGDADGAS